MEYARTNPPVERLVGGVMEFNRDSENVRRVNYMELLLKQEGSRERAFAEIERMKRILAKGRSLEEVAELFDTTAARVKKLTSS